MSLGLNELMNMMKMNLHQNLNFLWVNIAWGNGLEPSGNKLLFQPISSGIYDVLGLNELTMHNVTIRSSDNDSTGFWPPGSLHTLGTDGHI